MGKRYFPYKSGSQMQGPYELTRENAASLPYHIGVYLLAEVGEGGATLVCYVGRAEVLSRRVGRHVGKYSMFFFKEQNTDVGAFITECREFHRYGKVHHLDNRIHPARPKGSSFPLCSERGCFGEPD